MNLYKRKFIRQLISRFKLFKSKKTSKPSGQCRDCIFLRGTYLFSGEWSWECNHPNLHFIFSIKTNIFVCLYYDNLCLDSCDTCKFYKDNYRLHHCKLQDFVYKEKGVLLAPTDAIAFMKATKRTCQFHKKIK